MEDLETTMGAFEQDIDPVMAESKLLAINAKHGFISLEHFFVAMLNTACLAKSYLLDFDAEEHIDWLKKSFPNTGTETLEDNLPLTVYAENIIEHAAYFATLKEQPETTSVHVLLAMLSYDNDISERAKKKGLLFEDVAAAYFEQGLAKIPIQITPYSFDRPSFISRFLGMAPSTEVLLQDIYDHACNLFHYQQYDDSITTCQTGLELMPTHRGVKELLAYCFSAKRDYKSAAGHFQELANTFPDDLNYRHSLSFCYDNSEDYLSAEKILNDLLAENPDNEHILNNKGFNLYLQGKYAEAVPFFEKVIQINPLSAYPWDNLGFVKYKLGDTAQALALIDKALELDKGNSYAYKYKGIIFMEQNNKALAMKNFQTALKYGYTKAYGEEVLQLIEKCK